MPEKPSADSNKPSADAVAIAAASLASVLADLNRAHFTENMSDGKVAETARELYESAMWAVRGAWDDDEGEPKQPARIYGLGD